MSTEQKVRAFIVEEFLLGAAEPLCAGQSLLESGVVDSTGVLELVAFLERTFGIEVADDELVPDNLDTIENIVRFVEGKLARRAARPAPQGERGRA